MRDVEVANAVGISVVGAAVEVELDTGGRLIPRIELGYGSTYSVDDAACCDGVWYIMS